MNIEHISVSLEGLEKKMVSIQSEFSSISIEDKKAFRAIEKQLDELTVPINRLKTQLKKVHFEESKRNLSVKKISPYLAFVIANKKGLKQLEKHLKKMKSIIKLILKGLGTEDRRFKNDNNKRIIS